MTGNREYKSDVFSMLLEDKENALLLLDIYVPSSVIHSENRRRVTYGR